MGIKNPEQYYIVGYSGNCVGTLKKVTKAYFYDITGTKYSRKSSAGIPVMYSIVKKEKYDSIKAPINISVSPKNILSGEAAYKKSIRRNRR